jgi:hypothetical protein
MDQAPNSTAYRPANPWLGGFSLLMVLTLAVSAGIPSNALFEVSVGVGAGAGERAVYPQIVVRQVQVARRQQERPVGVAAGFESGGERGVGSGLSVRRTRVHIAASRVLVMHLSTPPPACA